MRVGFTGIIMGISIAVALYNDKTLTTQAITLSLLSEVMTILIFGLLELS